ncbi:MAG: fibronectin type III-like domain-contianing protein, partial [Bacteroidales bacterium]|nr:fibronectin type III-like domain-contianing protein [Bacteroidales bacterium]
VVQLYIGVNKCALRRPVRELKGFEKIFLKAGESRTVTFTLTPSDISRFDPEAHKWVADKGTYKALFGTSSADILAEATFEMK